MVNLLHLGGDERIALINLAKSVKHLGQLGRINRLHGYLQYRVCVELEWTKYVRLPHTQAQRYFNFVNSTIPCSFGAHYYNYYCYKRLTAFFPRQPG